MSTTVNELSISPTPTTSSTIITPTNANNSHQHMPCYDDQNDVYLKVNDLNNDQRNNNSNIGIGGDDSPSPTSSSVSSSSTDRSSSSSRTNQTTTTTTNNTISDHLLTCNKHKTNEYKYFCVQCNQPLCQDCCMLNDHLAHDISSLEDIGKQQVNNFQLFIDNSKLHSFNLRQKHDNFEQTLTDLYQKYFNAHISIDATYDVYKQMLDAKKMELKCQLNECFQIKKLLLTTILNKVKDLTSKLDNVNGFSESLFRTSKTEIEILLFKKPLESIINNLLLSNNDLLSLNQANNCQIFDLGFIINYQNYQLFQQIIKDTFGFILDTTQSSTSTSPDTAMSSTIATASPISLLTKQPSLESTPIGPLNSSKLGNPINSCSPKLNDMIDNLLNSPNGSNSLFSNDFITNIDSQSKDGSDIVTNSAGQSTHLLSLNNQRSLELLSTPLNNVFSKSIPYSPLKCQFLRKKMIYNCKFGEYGVSDGKFTEPSGVAINAQNNDIIVTDTNSHRVQIFNREGRFKFKFGKTGTNDSRLSYPNSVDIVKQTGDIIVTERSPTQQIKIYNQYGQFLRKFGSNILQHPRDVCVDSKGRIIVVECRVKRVIIFDQMGNVIHIFDGSKYLQFPNSVCCNDKEEIFISDNYAHCVKVFNYNGQFLREIGREGITNYPIGVDINSNGQVIITDNHKNFNLTVFTQTGQLINAFESKVKHAQCLDVALFDDDSIVLACKDYRFYVYKYSSTSQVQQQE